MCSLRQCIWVAILIRFVSLVLSIFSSAVFVAEITAATLQITSPASGSTISSYQVLVTGTITPAPDAEVAVTINGIAAALDMNGKFAAVAPIMPQMTSLTVSMKDTKGNSLANETIAVAVQFSEPKVILQPRPTVGIAPLTVSFDVTSLVPVNQMSLDADGDGRVDMQGKTLSGQSFSFQKPGLYYPLLKVTDNGGNTYSTESLIQVVDAKSFDQLLQRKWQGFKDALRAGDIPTALLYIAQDERAEFRQMFENLTVPLSSIDQVLTAIRFVQIRGNTVEYEMLRTDNRGQLSYPVHFVLDRDGIWRIQNI